MSNKTRTILLLGISFAAFMALSLTGPLKQNTNYHLFADARTLYKVPNFWNVVTNFPFCVIGLLGVLAVNKSRPIRTIKEQDISCYVFFIGVLLTGFGSAYYHWNPKNSTLVWDRLPMTMAFMGFFSFLISAYISKRAGQQILWPLVGVGIMSIVYWQFSGDLRLYVLVQFLPIVLTLLILLLYPSQAFTKYFWLIVLCYGIAKVFEAFDDLVFDHYGFSGHSIKHLLSAMAPASLLIGAKVISTKTQRLKEIPSRD